MSRVEREALEAAGWKFGDYGDFLGLSDAERQIVELRIRLSRAIREARERAGMTQADLASAMKSTQPRVARIEAGRRGVSLDQMMRAYFTVGGKADALFAADGAKERPPRGTNVVKKASAKVKAGKRAVEA
jgi:DNA-binding XRE family transcriptional regulator